MGGGGLVITDGDAEKSAALAKQIAEMYWEKRFDLEPETYTPERAIEHGLAIEGGPVLLVECADCCGGGAAGDSVCTLGAILEADLDVTSLAPVVDPEAAQLCKVAGEGASVDLALGHKLDTKWGEPLQLTGKVLRVSDGLFQYSGGIWKGTEGNMGVSAVVEIATGRGGRVQVLITTNATYDWADEQFQSMGMDPAAAKFVVVKNPMNYKIGYAETAKAAFILDTPGPTPATLRNVRYKNVARPYFPADAEIPGLEPQLLVQSGANQ
jgi:microcystin degradation protein MlrC